MDPHEMLSISIIIPFFNEGKTIKKCLQRALSYCIEKKWDFELIFVEDGCTDESPEIVNQMGLLDKRIKLLSVKPHLGKGGCITVAASTVATKEYIGYMDADLSTDPSEFQRLLGHIGQYDIVIGSRVLRGNLLPVKRRLHRYFLSKLYSTMFRRLFRISIHDPQCGFKLFKRNVFLDILNLLTVQKFAFDSDLIVSALTLGFQVKEVPIIWTEGESSRVRVLPEIKRMAVDLLSVWYKCHLLWLQSNLSYPNKKGSVYGQLLFKLLYLSNIFQENDLIDGNKKTIVSYILDKSSNQRTTLSAF
jgi:glycosyltransferase involved in cell wall biosynthesis